MPTTTSLEQEGATILLIRPTLFSLTQSRSNTSKLTLPGTGTRSKAESVSFRDGKITHVKRLAYV